MNHATFAIPSAPMASAWPRAAARDLGVKQAPFVADRAPMPDARGDLLVTHKRRPAEEPAIGEIAEALPDAVEVSSR
jgi:hypothetical protein